MDLILGFFLDTLWSAVLLAEQTAEYWAPPVLLTVFLRTWVYYVRLNAQSKKKWTLLEVKLPRETYKSPLAMEVVLDVFHVTHGESTWYDKYILGKTRSYFSLELVSIDGAVHFYIWTESMYKENIENTIYSQYPNIEVYEVPDYALQVPFGQEDSDWIMGWGHEMKLTKPDPYPIKTYVDYGLLDDPKEEYKIDPITPLLEYLGSLGPGEQAWIQIIIRATKPSNKQAGGLFGAPRDWKKEGEKLVEELRGEYGKQPDAGGEDKIQFERTMTKGQQNTISAIERNISKPGFDCGIRALYLAKKDSFHGYNIGGLLGAFKSFSSADMNGFAPTNMTAFTYPWSDITGARMKRRKSSLFKAYVRRSYFHPPYQRRHFVLNTEELATIFHFPGQVAITPTVSRIESKKTEPPVNLPG